jgi:hypothetical protein
MLHFLIVGVTDLQKENAVSTDMSDNAHRKLVRILRWIARILASIMAALILLFFVGETLGEGVQSLSHMTVREILLMFTFFALWLGLLLGWKWELLGGLLTLCAIIVFYALNILFAGIFPKGPFFIASALPSLLFLYCGWQNRI